MSSYTRRDGEELAEFWYPLVCSGNEIDEALLPEHIEHTLKQKARELDKFSFARECGNFLYMQSMRGDPTLEIGLGYMREIKRSGLPHRDAIRAILRRQGAL